MSSCRLSPSLESIASSGLLPSDEDFNLDSMPLDPTVHTERLTTTELVDDAPDRVQMDVAREEWVKFQAWEQQRNLLDTTSSAPKMIEKHARFFLPAENIFFLVANMLYSVPRASFERQSSAFTGKGLTEDGPLILEDVKVAHFDHFLSILYPSDHGMTASTVDEWTAILHLAVRWGFEFIKTLATKHIAPIAIAVDKIVLGRQYAINQWLGDAYLAICSREQCLSKEEGMRMDKEDIIEISAIRHHFGQGVQPNTAPPLLIANICARFGLTAPCAAASSPSSLASAESKSPSCAHCDGELIIPLIHGTGADAPPEEPAMVAEELNFEARVKAAGEIKRAHRAKEKELIDRAVITYISNCASPSCQDLDMAAIKEVTKEEYQQSARDFIATYIFENSESTSP